jgi:hypothetical protein
MMSLSAVSRNEIDILLQHLNSIEASIQITVEREINGHLAFLDLNVHRTVEEKLETDVYRKPTHTDKYLSYDSHHPVSHKRSVAKTLLDVLLNFKASAAETGINHGLKIIFLESTVHKLSTNALLVYH